MDETGPDIHNFSASSPTHHRLPTISGAEALLAASAKAQGISTGLRALDSCLLSSTLPFIASPGIQRGHVTEVFGVPGVGKTSFGLQLAVNAMHSQHEDSEVLWVNTGSPLMEERLDSMIESYQKPLNASITSSLPSSINPNVHVSPIENFTYIETVVLPQLLTIFLHPTSDFPSSRTCLIVVDDFSNLLLGSFSRDTRPTNAKSTMPTSTGPQGPPTAIQEKLTKKANAKRFQIIETLASGMSRLAALRNIAIVVLTNATMTVKSGQKATLRPALSSQAWDTTLHTRIMLYYDFPPPQEDFEDAVIKRQKRLTSLRYAEVQRLARKDVIAAAIPYVVTEGGLDELHFPDSDGSFQSEEIDGDPNLNPHLVSMRQSTTNASELPEPELPPLLPIELSASQRSIKRKIDEVDDSDEEEISGERAPYGDHSKYGDESDDEDQHDYEYGLGHGHEYENATEPKVDNGNEIDDIPINLALGPRGDDHELSPSQQNRQLGGEPVLSPHLLTYRENGESATRTLSILPVTTSAVVKPSAPSTHRQNHNNDTGDAKDQNEITHNDDSNDQENGSDDNDSPVGSAMILDVHETAVLRAYRHALIRGSEDASPVQSSPSPSPSDSSADLKLISGSNSDSPLSSIPDEVHEVPDSEDDD